MRTERHRHDPACSGCPLCNAELRRVARMTPRAHAAWLKKSAADLARDAAARRRAAVAPMPDTWGLGEPLAQRAASAAALPDSWGLDSLLGGAA